MLHYLNKIKEGFSEGVYENKKYGITKTTFNQGKSIKLYAKELGGNNFISLNYYITKENEFLKPCEMPTQKVITFLQDVQLNEANSS
ncbi:peptide methionine sulfoxide reductase [Tenacibaculum maritimum]|uniref:peptide methionine sulfoxide reductase n=1 Tax=Tenacibaculum maritimum TaxID=107401 RepID=UPI0012E5D63E|nr:peptide methionine sulfoxide reductase [Tenacibaculum maritimum]MCD9563888.1 peptide methionine sulfoxide reductase [Tenacibaculum maritimum]MCD9566482.1 peptide methionine sulfoxide reductase [Tenacibaculum maritimum]MCD9579783.1 peptide methionine sulfoxide reductase [Tenacibaculum maritimum]MCD9597326.1 peptide methionine sulfoxide reductase [Tenacibaculum maritimum]MCD9614400.1 peptide methionine sulfoxide reductase [Tenacibaculum maritimum]